MIALLMLFTTTVFAATPQEVFDAANDAYLRSDYGAAVSLYERLIMEFGLQDAAILFNLGNAYRQMGRSGKAIQCYEAALAVNPDFESAIHNRDRILATTRRNLSAPDPRDLRQQALRRYYGLSPSATLRLSCLALLTALLMRLWQEWRPNRVVKYLGAALPVTAALLFCLSLFLSITAEDSPQLGVTQVQEAPVYFSTSESGPPRFMLYEGDRVLIDRRENDWVRVNAYGGERGWTRKDHIGMVRSYLW